jgi:hypothetical protein
MLKSKGKTCMVEEPSHVKQLSQSQVWKIGLKPVQYYLYKFSILCTESSINNLIEKMPADQRKMGEERRGKGEGKGGELRRRGEREKLYLTSRLHSLK